MLIIRNYWRNFNRKVDLDFLCSVYL
uniref:Uncharacterized protein n=1 Tax=Limosilactobacillus reuteri TaxID=1598 RepID=E7D3V5_LIMRT|nr:unknown [Limosilactobacillus reuteri]